MNLPVLGDLEDLEVSFALQDLAYGPVVGDRPPPHTSRLRQDRVSRPEVDRCYYEVEPRYVGHVVVYLQRGGVQTVFFHLLRDHRRAMDGIQHRYFSVSIALR